jgi:hypothetical protein
MVAARSARDRATTVAIATTALPTVREHQREQRDRCEQPTH